MPGNKDGDGESGTWPRGECKSKGEPSGGINYLVVCCVMNKKGLLGREVLITCWIGRALRGAKSGIATSQTFHTVLLANKPSTPKIEKPWKH